MHTSWTSRMDGRDSFFPSACWGTRTFTGGDKYILKTVSGRYRSKYSESLLWMLKFDSWFGYFEQEPKLVPFLMSYLILIEFQVLIIVLQRFFVLRMERKRSQFATLHFTLQFNLLHLPPLAVIECFRECNGRRDYTEALITIPPAGSHQLCDFSD